MEKYNPGLPLVSIVMPTLNQRAFIETAVESVLSQDYAHLELIVMDGGSTDGTLAWLAAKQSEDIRLRWFSGADTGPANALNKAMELVRGTVIGWLNSDDLYAPGAVARAMAALQEHPEWVMVYGHGEHINEIGDSLEPYPTLPPEHSVRQFAEGCFICQPTVFFRRSLRVLLGDLNEELKTTFDFDYWIRAFTAFQGRIGFVNALQAYSRLHTSCITLRMRRFAMLEGMKVISRHFGTAPGHWAQNYITEVLEGKVELPAGSNLHEHVYGFAHEASRYLTDADSGRINSFLQREERLTPKNANITTNNNKLLRNDRKGFKFLLFGNCQFVGISNLLRSMLPESEVVVFELTPENERKIIEDEIDLKNLVFASDYIILQTLKEEEFYKKITSKYPGIEEKIRFIPRIVFSAFHPDADYITHLSNGQIGGELGPYHSVLAFYGWKNGFDVDQTIGLFRKDVFQHLGYFDYLEISKKFLITQGRLSGLPLEGQIYKWLSRGCFMHTMNHPKLFVLADLLKAVLSKEGIEPVPDIENYLEDELSYSHCWPVYPEIAKSLGISGHYYFKKGKFSHHENNPAIMLTLEAFVRGSFKEFAKFQPGDLTCTRLDSDRYKTLGDFLAAGSSSEQSSLTSLGNLLKSNNPYSGLPDYQFWKRAIATPTQEDVDPVVRTRFSINKTDKIATAGSCFAQHIARTLREHKFNYYVAEDGAGLLPDEVDGRNYGVFSARYGNIYTTRQLVQLFARAYGRFTPSDHAWTRVDGRFTDPFRPQIEPNGFSTLEELEASRTEHFKYVREMFESLDLFVFTLGLTESWRSKVDGAVFPLAPGVVSGKMDFDNYEFVNFETSEIVSDLEEFIANLLEVNPRARIIFTVSPVPLIATYENRHVLVSTTYSKAALRAAVDAIVRRYHICEYFPSYEIITGNFTLNSYYDKDLRSITPQGVSHVMRLFLKHFIEQNETMPMAPRNFEKDLLLEAERINQVICDEEAIVSA